MTEAINKGLALYVADDGVSYPITNWFDDEGAECAAVDAVTAVAGSGAAWFALTLSDFDERSRVQ